ncbi:MAG: DUF4019 domain-containing protein [Lentisphaerae bacterium]|nr:DUF4019 domain-containing protein [Lentisphaerota bacterium]
MRAVVASTLFVAVLGLAGCRAGRNPEAEKAAAAAAESWLRLVDAEKYVESWQEGSQFFRGAVPQGQWIQTMHAIRKPFGGNLSRELKGTRYRTAMPGAPDGQYVIVQFKTSFENKKAAIETVTPMLDRDGAWRVSGYFIK